MEYIPKHSTFKDLHGIYIKQGDVIDMIATNQATGTVYCIGDVFMVRSAFTDVELADIFSANDFVSCEITGKVNLEQHHCFVCQKPYVDIPLPYCCSGKDCGCHGMPEPPLCSLECCEKLYKK